MARPRDIKDPETLIIMFNEYVKETKSRPFVITDWVGPKAIKVERTKERPLTMEGFRAFGYMKGLTLKHYFDNQEGAYNEFCTICTRIKELIRQDQIEGGMSGMYNPSITQRLNGLTEKTENLNTNIEVKAEFGTTAKDEG